MLPEKTRLRMFPLTGTAHTCYNALYRPRFAARRVSLQVGGTAAVNWTDTWFGSNVEHQHGWVHFSNEECPCFFPFRTKWKSLHRTKKYVFASYTVVFVARQHLAISLSIKYHFKVLYSYSFFTAINFY